MKEENERWQVNGSTTVCPVCKHEFDTGNLYGVGDIFLGLPAHCPHCGARMWDGEKQIEVFRNGEPTGMHFRFSENARLWVNNQKDGAAYSMGEVYTIANTRTADSTVVYTTA